MVSGMPAGYADGRWSVAPSIRHDTPRGGSLRELREADTTVLCVHISSMPIVMLLPKKL